MTQQREYASEEQRVYADVLDWGMKIGFLLLVLTFLLYVFGALQPHVPLHELPQYWTLPAAEYMQVANVPHGWGWLSLAGTGDYINFIPIAILALITIVCYIRLLPLLWRSGDKAYTGIAIAEIAVLVLAASGVLVVGH